MKKASAISCAVVALVLLVGFICSIIQVYSIQENIEADNIAGLYWATRMPLGTKIFRDRYIQGYRYSIESGNAGAVEVFAGSGSLGPNFRFTNGDYPIHLASSLDSLSVCETLLREGARLDTLGQSGSTALHACGNTAIADFLLSNNLDINARNKYGDTPLILAAKNGDLEVLKFLSEKGAKDLAGDNGGVFHVCDDLRLLKELKLLNYDINVLDPRGNTALHYAVADNNMKKVEFLITNGVDTSIKNTDGLAALECAEKYGHYEIAKKILQK